MDEITTAFDPYNKKDRQDNILKILSSDIRVETQTQLTDLLNDRGFDCTQPTVARDIKSLKVTKSEEGIYVIDAALKKRRIEDDLLDFITETNPHIFHTSTFFTITSKEGYESLTAKKIKDAFSEYILGTIVGDGIIIVFTNSDKTSRYVCSEIERIRTM